MTRGVSPAVKSERTKFKKELKILDVSCRVIHNSSCVLPYYIQHEQQKNGENKKKSSRSI